MRQARGANEGQKMIRALAGAALAALMCWCSTAAQIADTHPAFEAASVKVAARPVSGADTRMRGGPGTGDPGRIVYPYVSMDVLLIAAFGVNGDQISGPDWIWLPEEMYSVEATLPPNTTKDRFRLMLQNLLAERFHLVVHHATKEFPVFELAAASGGPKMTPSAPDSAPAAASPVDVDQTGFPVLPPGSSALIIPHEGIVRGRFRITMSDFAQRLPPLIGLSSDAEVIGPGVTLPRVVDKTGLEGKFDFTLEFAGSLRLPAAVAIAQAAARGDQPSGASEASEPAGGVSLFTALEKQLGLKLVKGKTASLDLLVIDHIDRKPTEN